MITAKMKIVDPEGGVYHSDAPDTNLLVAYGTLKNPATMERFDQSARRIKQIQAPVVGVLVGQLYAQATDIKTVDEARAAQQLSDPFPRTLEVVTWEVDPKSFTKLDQYEFPDLERAAIELDGNMHFVYLGDGSPALKMAIAKGRFTQSYNCKRFQPYIDADIEIHALRGKDDRLDALIEARFFEAAMMDPSDDTLPTDTAPDKREILGELVKITMAHRQTAGAMTALILKYLQK